MKTVRTALLCAKTLTFDRLFVDNGSYDHMFYALRAVFHPVYMTDLLRIPHPMNSTRANRLSMILHHFQSTRSALYIDGVFVHEERNKFISKHKQTKNKIIILGRRVNNK